MSSLPALLKLCDDSSPVVSARVAARLREMGGATVWREIEKQNLAVLPSQRAVLEEIFSLDDDKDNDNADQTLRETWEWLQTQTNEHRALESALLALCDWQNGAGSGDQARLRLDDLATQFGDYEWETLDETRGEAAALAHFLFEVQNLRGAPSDDFYNPLHSDLLYALEARRALPITLACVFILVGRRVGLSIQGCSFPGHFLARDGASEQVFDPFNGGRLLTPREVGALHKVAPAALNGPAPAREIVARVLRNLSVAFYRGGEREKAALMRELLGMMNAE